MTRHHVVIGCVLVLLPCFGRWAQAQCYAEQMTFLPDPDFNFVSVAMDGNVAVLGANDLYNNQGEACVYRFDGTTWVLEARLVNDDPVTYASDFGHSVAVSGNVIVVGEYYRDHGLGAAWIFRFDGTTWNKEAELQRPPSENPVIFGFSVSVHGDVAVIGDSGGPAGSGLAHVYRYDGSTWQEEAQLPPWGDHGDLFFAWSLALDGNALLVGSPVDANDMGCVYVYRFDGTDWLPRARLQASDFTAKDEFGFSVSLQGDLALIGARRYGRPGRAYVFRFDGTAWTQQAELEASDGFDGDEFGFGVTIAGNAAVVTAAAQNVPTKKGGSYFFRFDGTAWFEQERDKRYLYNANTAMSDVGNLALVQDYQGRAHGYVSPVAASSTPYGTGWPGSNGVPDLTSDLPIVGSTFTLSIDNSRGSDTVAVIIAGVVSASVPTSAGGTLLVLPSLLLPVAIPANGLDVPAALPSDCQLVFTPLYVQVLEVDPGATNGVSFTSGLALSFGDH